MTEPSFLVRRWDTSGAHDAHMAELLTRLMRWGNDGAARNAGRVLAATARDHAAVDATIEHVTRRERPAA